MSIWQFFSEAELNTAILLLARISALCVFFPFYSHIQINFVIKSSLALMLTFYLYPLTNGVVDSSAGSLIVGILLELLLGFCAALALNLSFTILQMAGEHISFVMGFSLASVIDPNSGSQTPIIGHFLSLLALLLYLLYDGHHLSLLLLKHSLSSVPLMSFSLDQRWWILLMQQAKDIYLIGLCMAFPIIALSMIGDFAFGMLMKTMPQFNLLVVGYPIKIMVSFAVLMVILATILNYFKAIIFNVYASLSAILGG